MVGNQVVYRPSRWANRDEIWIGNSKKRIRRWRSEPGVQASKWSHHQGAKSQYPNRICFNQQAMHRMWTTIRIEAEIPMIIKETQPNRRSDWGNRSKISRTSALIWIKPQIRIANKNQIASFTTSWAIWRRTFLKRKPRNRPIIKIRSSKDPQTRWDHKTQTTVPMPDSNPTKPSTSTEPHNTSSGWNVLGSASVPQGTPDITNSIRREPPRRTMAITRSTHKPSKQLSIMIRVTEARWIWGRSIRTSIGLRTIHYDCRILHSRTRASYLLQTYLPSTLTTNRSWEGYNGRASKKRKVFTFFSIQSRRGVSITTSAAKWARPTPKRTGPPRTTWPQSQDPCSRSKVKARARATRRTRTGRWAMWWCHLPKRTSWIGTRTR